jgi:hypothetical protein
VSRRQELADKCRTAWFADQAGTPIGERWLLVADAVLAEGKPVASPLDSLTGAWAEVAEPVRDHRYEINIIYPEVGECYERGVASAAELAHRLRFEASLCAPGATVGAPSLPLPDEVVDGAPTWKATSLVGLPQRWTAWNNGVQLDRAEIVDDLDGLHRTALAMLAAVAQVRAWRQP